MSANTISVNVLANTAELVTGMRRAENAVARSTRTMTKAVVAFAGVFASAQFLSGIKTTADELDKIGKTSAKIGISAEALQELQFAGEQTGVSVETTNMALQRMTRRLSEANQGTGEAVNALKELGLSAEDLATKSVDEQFKDIADAMSKVPNQADRVRLSMKIFDSEGVGLVSTLASGSKGLEEFAAQANKAGIIVSGKAIKSVEAFGDKINIMTKQFDAVKGAVTSGVAVAFNIIYDSIVDSSKGFSLFDVVLIGTLKTIKFFVDAFDVATALVKASVSGLIVIYAGFNEIAAHMGGNLAEIADAELLTAAATKSAAKEVEYQIEVMKNGSSTSQKLAGSIKDFGVQINVTKDSVKKFSKSLGNGGGDSGPGAKKVTEEMTAVIGAFGGALSNTENALVEFAKTGELSFADFTASVLEDLARLIFKLTVTIPLIRAVTSGLKGGSGTGALGDLGALLGYKASGGNIGATGAYLVGERGPEIVNLNRGDHVTANSNLSSGLNVNIVNNTPATVQATQTSGGLDISIDMLDAHIAQGISNNSSLIARAIKGSY